MEKFLNLLISGIVTGGIYSIMASGLVMTYEMSGVFNFAHAAVAFTCAYFYYQLNTGQHVPVVPALIVTVFGFAPLLGLALNRLVFERLASAPVFARLVGTVGVLIALPNFVQWVIDALLVNGIHLNIPDLARFGSNAGFNPPGIGPTPPRVFGFGWAGLPGVHLTSDQLAVFIVAALAALLLYVVIRRTRIGLEMRAQVDRPQLASLRGVNSGRTSQVAWIFSMTLAGLGGVLIAPLFQLSSDTFVLVVFASLAAVAVAGVRSIPVSFAAGLGLGVLQDLVAGYQTQILPGFLSNLSGLEGSVPYVVLIVALFASGRRRVRAAGSVSDEKPAPDPRAGLPLWRRRLPWVIVTALLALYAVGALPWPTNPSFVRSSILGPGLALGIVFLSFVIVTGIGGMVSLAQASFVTIGGFTAGWALQTVGSGPHLPPWASWDVSIPFILGGGHLNFLLAALLGAVAAGLVGVIIAFGVRRMGVLELALATFAFSWVLYFLVFQNNAISNGSNGYTFPAPVLSLFGLYTVNFTDSRWLVCLMLVLFGLIALLIRNLQNSASGRAMFALRSSSVAAQTSGISPARVQVMLFGLSAAVAGFGGVMYGVTSLTMTSDSVPPLLGLTWLAVAVTFGVRRSGGALLAGLAYTSGSVIWTDIAHVSWMPNVIGSLITSSYFLPMLFGLGAVNLAKNPDGVLAMVGQGRLESRRARARASHIAEAEQELGNDREPAAGPGAAPVPDLRPGSQVKTAPAPALLIENVVAGYDDVEVLHGVTVEVQRGQIVTLLGANGAGKSTLCNVVGGAVPVTSGRILIDGHDVSATTPFARARNGMLLIPEARGVFPGLSVEENLEILIRQPRQREQAYERFPILGQRRRQHAGLLSGGEQQMLSLAPALVAPPAVLIADEPTLGLAPLAAGVVLEALADLRAMGTAVLLVEEKASEVMKVADVVAFMELGRIVWTGPGEEASREQLAAAYLGRAPQSQPSATEPGSGVALPTGL